MRFDFNFRKRLGEEHLTPEQLEIVDLLERGEISEEEAERRLGADVRVSTYELGGVGDERPSVEAAPDETDEDARARELVERIAREVDGETGASLSTREPESPSPQQTQALVEGLMLGAIAPDDAARKLEAALPPAAPAAREPRDPASADDERAARLVADVVRQVEAAEAREPKPGLLPDGRFGRIALGALGLLGVAALLGGDEALSHIFVSALVAAGSFVLFLVLGAPPGMIPRRRPLVPPAPIWGALAMLAWGLLLVVSGNWDAYMPSILVVGFLVAIAVAGAGALGMARRAEETIDVMRARRDADAER